MKYRAFILFLSVVTFSYITAFSQDKKSDNATIFGVSLIDANQLAVEKGKVIRCVSSEYELSLKQQSPGRSSEVEFEAWLSKKIAQFKQSSTTHRQARAIQTLPVIFHVITDGSGPENVSETLISAQIEQMNNDFANLSGSSYAVAADTEIQFCLAQQSEDGEQLVESGINRVTTYGEGPFDINYINNTIKPNTQWNPLEYLNIWIVSKITSSGNQPLGFAQFPTNSGLPDLTNNYAADKDGVVVIAETIGSLTNHNPNGGVYGYGRTLVHEIGHFLGLKHIWGDGDCTADDYCDDTPLADGNTEGCPTNKDTCPTDPGNDMIENYMDYSNDACMNTFTEDQKTRMLTVLANSPRRKELVTSNRCQPGVVYNLDGRLDIETLNQADCNNTITPQIRITNKGNNTLTSATITYQVDSGSMNTYNWSGSLSTGNSQLVNLPAMVISSGSHTFSTELINPNGGTDERTNNNSETLVFKINESYAGTTQIVLSITLDNFAQETKWEFKNSAGTILNNVTYTQQDSDKTYNYTFNVNPNECYSFTIFDSENDGICCDYGNGKYDLKTNDGTLIFSGAAFRSSETVIIPTVTYSTHSYFTDNNISLYPNPTTTTLNIKIANTNILPETLQMYNMLGQQVVQKTISNQGDLTVDVSYLSKGMYFVRLVRERTFVTLPFIKK